MKSDLSIHTGLILALVTGLALAIPTASAQVVVPGNPTCEDLGYDFGFKPQPEPPPSGTYPYPHDPNHDVTITTDGTHFDWQSTLPVDAVIVKGGNNANVYEYNPGAFGDSHLHSPVNSKNGKTYEISHIDFCWDQKLHISKSAETSFTRAFDWGISKTVIPDTWQLFNGDTGKSVLNITAEKTGFTDSDWVVSGVITIFNTIPHDATIESVTDVISGFGPVAVDCGVSFPFSLPAGDTLLCEYSTPLPDGTTRSNTATVVASGGIGGETTAEVVFCDPTTTVNAEINVDDTSGMSWLFTDSGVQTYERGFTCGADEGVNQNIATIRETGQSDDAVVVVQCFSLDVRKDATASFNQVWDWTIDKSAHPEQVTLAPGQTFVAEYQVTVDATATDGIWQASGTIVISSNHPTREAVLASVTDIVSPDLIATVSCPASTVPAGGQLICTYSVDLPDDSARTNTATVSQQNHVFGFDGSASPAGTTDYSASAEVVFGGDPGVSDECINLSDPTTDFGDINPVCVDDGLPATFEYSADIGPFHDEVCHDPCFQVVNTVSYETLDTHTTGSAQATIEVILACDHGCTLTQGYWKTHSEYGPAPYDDAWVLLPHGADTEFFKSGGSYFEALWKQPKGGNASYILAHQYIAAELNRLNGASMPHEIRLVFKKATTLFTVYTPGQIKALKNKRGHVALRSKFLTYAAALDWYNRGILGPGHCDE